MKVTFRKAAGLLITAMLALGLAAGITGCKIEPDEPELTKIEVTAKPTKTEYFVGDAFDASGLKVTAVYSDGAKEDVTKDAKLSGFDSSAAADSQKITVTYEGKTATFTVKITAIELTGITVTTKPTKTEYIVGEELNLAGIKVTATYNNGTTADVTDEVEASGFDSSAAADSQTVTVTYEGKTATFTVKITAVEVTKIELESEPAKKEYFVGDSIDLTGIKVTATYNNGTTADVTASVTTDFDSSTAAESKTVTVTYGGKTATFTVKIKAIELTGIAVTTQPAQKEYCIDEALDKTGLIVTATYNNGTTADVTSLVELSGFNSSAAVDSQTVTVTYSGKTATFTVTIKNMKKMTVKEFITALGTAVETITYDTTKPAGVTLSTDKKTANVYNVKLSGAFSNLIGYKFPTKLVTADLRGLDTSGVKYMYCMFRSCSSLTSLDVSSFDTSSVTDMSYMFSGCSKLTSLDVSSFDTSSVTNMYYMFSGCKSLTSLNVSGFNTSSVTDMGYMFSYFTELTSLDLSSFDTSAVTSKNSMFQSCGTAETPLAVIYGSGWTLGTDTTLLGATNLSFTLKQEMTVKDFITALGTAVETITYDTTKPAGVTLSTDGKTANVYGVKLSGAFGNSTGYKFPTTLVTADLRGLDTSGVTSMSHMFHQCRSLTSLDVSSFNTSSVKLMDCMFEQCNLLTSLDVSRFDTSSVTGMYYMFSGCSKLTSLDVSNFDTSSVRDMNYMFSSCKELTSLDVSRFNTSKVKNMGYMFSYCTKLTSLDVSHFDTSSVTYMFCIFQHCESLTSLDVSRFNTSKVTNMGNMFSSCTSLTSLDLSSFDTSAVTSKDKMFQLCGTAETPLAVTYSTGWTLGTEATLLGATNLSFTLKQ